MVTAKLYAVAGLGLALVLAGLLSLALWYRGQAISAQADAAAARVSLATAQAANEAQKAAIESLTAFRRMDDNLLVELQGKLSELATQTQQATVAVRDLERTNANVKSYLATRIPAELRGVLNRASGGKPAGSGERPSAR